MTPWLRKLFSRDRPVPAIPEKSAVQTTTASTDSHSSLMQRRLGNDFLAKDDLKAATACYERAVALDARSVDALTSLGYALKESGELARAQQHLARACDLDPKSFDATYLLGQVLNELRLFETAVVALEKALTLRPESEPLYAELCQANFNAGAVDKALTVINDGIQKYPANPLFHLYAGNLLLEAGDAGQALVCYRKCEDINPDDPTVQVNLAMAFLARNEPHLAMDYASRAMASSPMSPDAHNCLGACHEAAGSLEIALSHFTKALSIDSSHVNALRGMGNVHFKLGQHDSALLSMQKALAFSPNSPEIHRDLGAVFLQLGDFKASERASRQALALKPNLPGAQNNLSNALAATGKLLEAEDCLKLALEAEPESAAFLANLGGVLLWQGRVSEGIVKFRSARNADPLFMAAHHNLLFALSIEQTSTNDAYLEEASVFSRSLEAFRAASYIDWPSIDLGVNPESLRVGFVSGNFRANPVGFFLESTLARLKSSRVELIAYATSDKVDALTERIRPAFKHWVNSFGMDDAALADKIRKDGIHVLVDLNGHSDGNRLPVFVRKPAPLQVSWLGYWASTGLREIDFVLMDEVSLPEHNQHQFIEAVHYLPDTRLCFTPPEPEVPVGPLPALQNGHITFGCFQVRTKVNDAVLSLWSNVLHAVPHSRLRLASNQTNDSALRKQLRARFEKAGIDMARVTLVGPVPREQYLRSYGEVDFILDTFPFTGGTTTCEALWMGVPTLTMTGNTLIARQGTSMLGCVGLTDWIAVDEADYLNKAVQHAADPHALHLLRASLRKRTLASPLCDAERFAGHLEQSFFDMWYRKYPSVQPQA
jgi:predicted O-linked N-acetylglucosamine transferase (SPINDLY family)